jgi:signal transduction histidine kinase
LKESITKEQENSVQLIKINNEKKEILESQNLLLEKKVTDRTVDLKNSLENLKATQSQLIQSEKMASLGELTAGIAHEIQNPLNFVNNFSEVSKEMIQEMREEIKLGDYEEAKLISIDLEDNLEKIHHHGKRADSIVKGMLMHSSSGKGEKILTDVNALCDEFLRLSYHGMRAKERNFNADFETDFDTSVPKVNVVPQDIGRVLLNLINNAFYAVSDRALANADSSFKPKVIVSTKSLEDKIQILIDDNGPGIPEEIKDKIFQPFFTTKPTGQGTGLGLSLSYDIIKAHGGEIEVESEEGKGTTFYIHLPTV